jgi:hypothetical protein
MLTEQLGGGKIVTGYRALMFGADLEPRSLPNHGITLLDCLKRIPRMRDALATCGEQTEVVRATVTATLSQSKKQLLKVIVHPGIPEMVERCLSQFIISREATINQIAILEFPVGVSVEWETNGLQTQVAEVPYGIAEDSDSTYLSCRREFLNEFGLLYVALHIVGNLARYFPDKWIAHVESTTHLAIAIEQLLQVATERMPILCLSELTQTLHVAEA